jgi:lactate permease
VEKAGFWIGRFPINGLHNLILRASPVLPKVSAEAAVYVFNILSAAGTGIFLAALLAGKTAPSVDGR